MVIKGINVNDHGSDFEKLQKVLSASLFISL